MTKLIDYKSHEKTILLECFNRYPMLDKWIATLIENFIYSIKKETQGQIVSTYRTKYGQKDGECKRYCENNCLFNHCYFVQNQLHGPFKLYYNHINTLKKETFYKHGKIHGSFKEWYKNGQLFVETNYENGKMNGTYKEYFRETGLLHIETCYLYGIKNGKYKEWYLNSQLAIETYYVNGKMYGNYKEWSEDSVQIFDSIIIDEK